MQSTRRARYQNETSVYEPRVMRAHPVMDMAEILFKPYEISQNGVEPTLVDTAFGHAKNELAPRLSSQVASVGVGYLILHRGMHRNWLLLRTWCEGGIIAGLLHHDQGAGFSVVEEPILECVWEAVVIGFERDAWVRSWGSSATQQMDTYLKDRLPDGNY